MKQQLSLIEMKTTIGFIYWIKEYNDLRGLKEAKIEEFPMKLTELQKKYNIKYPNGLTGWGE